MLNALNCILFDRINCTEFLLERQNLTNEKNLKNPEREMKKRVLTMLVGGAFATALSAQITIYQETFESMAAGDTAAGYVIGKKIYDSTYTNEVNAWFANVGVSTAQAVVQTGQSGPDQGINVLKTIPDYGWAPDYENNQIVDTYVLRGLTLTAPQVADGYITFTFDYKAWPELEGGLVDPQFNQVFMEVLDPNAGWSVTESVSQMVTASDDTWSSGSISVPVTGASEGLFLQWGFISQAQNYSAGAMAVDNLVVQTSAVPEPSVFALLGGALAFGFVLYRRRR
jgi:hypothetical protein